MTRLAASLVLAALLGACATRHPGPGAFAFAVVGDTPYSDAEEARFLAMMRAIDREPLAFVIHVGDIKGAGPCSDALYARRKAEFDRSAHPFIYTPGDNEWTDCRRAKTGSTDPIERLARLRQVFFADRWSLGRTRIATKAQDRCIAPVVPDCGCAAHPENRAWTYGGVRFVTLDVPGSDNNVGYDRRNDEEARCRNEANRQWLERSVAAAGSDDIRALVIAVQADPWRSRKPVYRDFIREVEAAAARLDKPVLFVHGDTHVYRYDFPFTDSLGNPILGVRRLETYGSPFVGWVKVTVDPASPEPFAAEPELFALVPPAR